MLETLNPTSTKCCLRWSVVPPPSHRDAPASVFGPAWTSCLCRHCRIWKCSLKVEKKPPTNKQMNRREAVKEQAGLLLTPPSWEEHQNVSTSTRNFTDDSEWSWKSLQTCRVSALKETFGDFHVYISSLRSCLKADGAVAASVFT